MRRIARYDDDAVAVLGQCSRDALGEDFHSPHRGGEVRRKNPIGFRHRAILRWTMMFRRRSRDIWGGACGGLRVSG